MARNYAMKPDDILLPKPYFAKHAFLSLLVKPSQNLKTSQNVILPPSLLLPLPRPSPIPQFNSGCCTWKPIPRIVLPRNMAEQKQIYRQR